MASSQAANLKGLLLTSKVPAMNNTTDVAIQPRLLVSVSVSVSEHHDACSNSLVITKSTFLQMLEETTEAKTTGKSRAIRPHDAV